MARVFASANCTEAHLSGVLWEFREALRREIEAARRHESSSGTALANGRRIAQIGGAYQYVFDLENALNLPGDAPGDLYIPGHSPLPVIVISVDGMAMTLSVTQDLGSFVPEARLQSNLAHLMRKLIERIEALAGEPNPAGERARGAMPVSGEPASALLSDELNPEQKKAVRSTLGRDTTFVWGPPGTGKTRTIGALGENLYRRGRSVLLVSHTNIAVDQALLWIAEALDPADFADGSVLRVGQPRDPRLHTRQDLLLATHVDRRAKELSAKRDALQAERDPAAEEVIKLCRKIDICEWLTEGERDIPRMDEELTAVQGLEANLADARTCQSELRAASPRWKAAARLAEDVQGHIAGMPKLDERIARAKRGLAAESAELDALSSRLRHAEGVYREASSVGRLTRLWRRLPSPEAQERALEQLRSEHGELQGSLQQNRAKVAEAERYRGALADKVKAFRREHGAAPEEVLHRAKAHSAELVELLSRIQGLRGESIERRLRLEDVLRERLCALCQWKLASESTGPAEVTLDAIKCAHQAAASEVAGQNPASLRAERDGVNTRITDLDAEIRKINEALKKVEQLVIADATIVATTLTRAYLRSSIQSRRFDTVILDEASMAPIPALWVAASLAKANVVIVGDFKQLPPIVLSQDKLARKWLGRDIFEEAGLSSARSRAPYFVALRRQYRMHPHISAIPNALIYDGRLKDGGSTFGKGSDDALMKWYRADWGHDSSVLLVDTASVHAWVTSVPSGAGSSRLNFLSATICVDLAEQLLSQERPALPVGAAPRILITCPYRPHARLVELMLREAAVADEVRAGTAHSFQGAEADVVIFDLVNDEPHWRVAMFMPARDDEMKRLLNVALTRARRRLIIVGDFKYIRAQARRAFLGAELLPFLKRYRCVEAMDVVPTGLAARAAKAQVAVMGGDVAPDAARLVVTQQHFFSFLRGDLRRAKGRAVIYSPFITQSRVSQLEPQLRAAVERDVRVYVVTKAHGDRGKHELAQYRRLEQVLLSWRVRVIHKRRMHEKLVVIDDSVLWTGSLNPLSHSSTQEIMERRVNRKIVKDYAATLRLGDLLAEYDDGPPSCPICGSEIVATEGRDDPFFWRCVEKDCYSRSIDDPRLRDGVVRCTNCAGEVEYGEWGGRPCWRCRENKRHHQKVARTHLRLPKMRALIPKRELRALEKRFGIDSSGNRPDRSYRQGRLFGSDNGQ